MSTLREQAQFIDELRQHYRRLDGLLVRFRDRVSTDELWDVNLCVLALRRLLFGGIGDPNRTETWFAEGSVGSPRPNYATAMDGAPCPIPRGGPERTTVNAAEPAPATGQIISTTEGVRNGRSEEATMSAVRGVGAKEEERRVGESLAAKETQPSRHGAQADLPAIRRDSAAVTDALKAPSGLRLVPMSVHDPAEDIEVIP